jgi:hypothetical protein
VFLGIVLAWAPQAPAQFTDLQRTLFRGTEFAGNRLFLSNPQGGPLFDFNTFSQRLEFNRAGQGYTYESFRFFGPDSFGNTNTLDLGPFKIELGMDPTLVTSGQPVGIHSRVGYTTRFIPEVFFEAQTGQRAFDVFSAISTFAPTPVNYTVSFNAGVQDFEWTGNAFIDMGGRVNALGFYDFDLRMTNVGNYEADGILLHDEQVTDFDVGPINVSGNLLFDAVAGLLQADGTPGDAVPPRIFSGAAQKEVTLDELLAQLEAGEALGDGEMQFIAQQMFTAAFIADPLGVLLNGLPSQVPGFEELTLSMSAPPQDRGDQGSWGEFEAVPEPGTLGLLAAAAGTLLAARPFGRRRR